MSLLSKMFLLCAFEGCCCFWGVALHRLSVTEVEASLESRRGVKGNNFESIVAASNEDEGRQTSL
jgi:hypothetical protein